METVINVALFVGILVITKQGEMCIQSLNASALTSMLLFIAWIGLLLGVYLLLLKGVGMLFKD